MPQVGIYSGDPATILAQSNTMGTWLAQKIVGSYYSAAMQYGAQMATTTAAGAPDNINCYPFFVPRTWRIDRYAFRGGNAVAGARVRTGIYDSDPVSHLPRNLVYDNGETDVSGGTAVYETVCDVTLPPGLYYTTKIQNNNKTFYLLTAATQAAQLGFADTVTYNHYNYYALAQAYGALPNPHPGGGTFGYSATGNFMVLMRTLEG